MTGDIFNTPCEKCGKFDEKYQPPHVCEGVPETIGGTLDPAYCYGPEDHKTKLIGTKNDEGKPRWSLLPFSAVNEIVKVLDFGARKYSRNNWMHVSNYQDRYLSAALRHLAAWGSGETEEDGESGLSHLAHAGCSILFLIWKELECSKAQSKKP